MAAHQIMDQLGDNLKQLKEGIQMDQRLIWSILNSQSFKKKICLASGEPLIQIKLRNGSRQWRRSFPVLVYTDYQKVAFTNYMLEADVEFWWNGLKRLLEESQADITWEVFKDAFYQKYFPASVRNAKELEFMQLRQGGRNVLEYIAKVEELCKFSTIYQQNPDEVQKCVNLNGELREDILPTVGPMEIRDFATLVNKCRLIEEYN